MKKVLRETQTLHASYNVVRQSQNFCPAADPLPGCKWPKFNQLEMVTTLPTNPVC